MTDYLKTSTQQILGEFMLRKKLTVFDYVSTNRLEGYPVHDIEELVLQPIKAYFDECTSELHRRVILENHLFPIANYLYTRAVSFYLESLEHDEILKEDKEFCRCLSDKYNGILAELKKHAGTRILKKPDTPFCDVYGE